MFIPKEYWTSRFGADIQRKKGTHCTGNQPYYYDFDWSETFPTTPKNNSYFPGLKHVSTKILRIVPAGTKWKNIHLFMKKDLGTSFQHEIVDDCFVFVFDIDTWKAGRQDPVSAKSAKGITDDATTAKLVTKLLTSPEDIRAAFLEADPDQLFVGVAATEAASLLPRALQAVSEAFQHDSILADDPIPNLDQEKLLSVLQRLMAIAAKRGEVSKVMSVLDGLDDAKRAFFNKNADIVRLVAEHDITTQEVTSWAYRQDQAEIFDDLLNKPGELEKYKTQHSITADGEEPAWQHFFECNRWIFGLALDYFFNEALSEKRLEVYSLGHSIFNDGKRPDGLLASAAILRSLCFVEIKTPAKFLVGKDYRTDTWAPHWHLTGAVAQSQKTVHRSIKPLADRFKMEDEVGLEYGDPIYTIRPRSFLIIGRSAEFLTNDGQEKKKIAAGFELYRRHMLAPEIYTFDELLERAKRLAHPSTVSEPNVALPADSKEPAPARSASTDTAQKASPTDDTQEPSDGGPT